MLADERSEFVAVCHGNSQGRRETLDNVVNMVARRDRNAVCRWAILLGNEFNHRIHVTHVGSLLPVENSTGDSQFVSSKAADVSPQFLKSRTERNQSGGRRRKKSILQRGVSCISVLAEGFGKYAHDGLEIDRDGLGGRCDDVLVMQVGEVHQIGESQQLSGATVVMCGGRAARESLVANGGNPCVVAAVRYSREPEIQPLTVTRPLRHPGPQRGKKEFISC